MIQTVAHVAADASGDSSRALDRILLVVQPLHHRSELAEQRCQGRRDVIDVLGGHFGSRGG
jgi:hypothetical protein